MTTKDQGRRIARPRAKSRSLAAHLPQIDPNRRELTISRTSPRRARSSGRHGPIRDIWRNGGGRWLHQSGLRNGSPAGGAINIVMRAPDGTDYPMRGEFKEIAPPEKLVFTNYPVDAKASNDRWLTTVTFVEARRHNRNDASDPGGRPGAPSGLHDCGHGRGLEPEHREAGGFRARRIAAMLAGRPSNVSGWLHIAAPSSKCLATRWRTFVRKNLIVSLAPEMGRR